MDPNWAAENLQVIRTLMERSALYRRALAPIMTVAGSIGLVASIIPCFSPIHSTTGFASFWMAVAVVAVIAAFLLVRRQAFREGDRFWSPPTQRVVRALTPHFAIGLFVGLNFAFTDIFGGTPPVWLLP